MLDDILIHFLSFNIKVALKIAFVFILMLDVLCLPMEDHKLRHSYMLPGHFTNRGGEIGGKRLSHSQRFASGFAAWQPG